MKITEELAIKMIIGEDLTEEEKILVKEVELRQALKKALKEMGRLTYNKTIKKLLKEV